MRKLVFVLLLSMAILSACGTKSESVEKNADKNDMIAEELENKVESDEGDQPEQIPESEVQMENTDETTAANPIDERGTNEVEDKSSNQQQNQSQQSEPQESKQPEQQSKPQQSEPTETPKVEQGVNVDEYWGYYEEVLSLVNQLRAEVGVAPLTLDKSLCKPAIVRANEMAEACDLSHTRPSGKQFYTALSECGISFSTCGENVAAGQKSPAMVVEDWKNSPDHYQNIIDADFSKMGVGYSPSHDKYGSYWCQLFTN